MEGYYEDGMRVPDDVILLWSDDKCVSHDIQPAETDTCRHHSWGNVRRYPIPSERNRTGGYGVYYHVGYLRLEDCHSAHKVLGRLCGRPEGLQVDHGWFSSLRPRQQVLTPVLEQPN